MCRYAFSNYKTSWACIPCRHVAQYPHPSVLPQARWPVCPLCREPMLHAGRDFQAPRKGNRSEWNAVAAVLNSGNDYDSCGCTGPGWRPRTKAELRRAEQERRAA